MDKVKNAKLKRVIKDLPPAVKTYNTTIKSYTSAIRQLTALLETEEQKEEIDDFQKITGLM